MARWPAGLMILFSASGLMLGQGLGAQSAKPGAAGPGAPTSRPSDSASVPRFVPAGDCLRSLEVDGVARSYLVHVPPGYDAAKPTPVVLIFHGAGASAYAQAALSGLSKKADSAGFLAVYPNGNQGVFSAWTAPVLAGRRIDDVKFTARILDDLGDAVNVDKRRVYATGISNGGMMCYRLAAEMSDRIAAIAAVSGTMTNANPSPKRPVPVLHLHGTADKVLAYDGPPALGRKGWSYMSVDSTVKTWAKLDGCPEKPQIIVLPDTAHDGTTVTRKIYGPGKDGAEVVLYTIEGGGHTWPGGPSGEKLLGKSTRNLSANDLIWEFFQKHPMRPAPATQPGKGDKQIERNPPLAADARPPLECSATR